MNLLSKKAVLAATATVALTTATTVFTSKPAHAFKIFTTAGETVNNTVVNSQVPAGWLTPPPNPTTFDFSGLSTGSGGGNVPDVTTLLQGSTANGGVSIQDGGSGATYSNASPRPASGGSNDYLLIAAGQTVTLTFSPRQEYFGFLWGQAENGSSPNRAGQTIEFFKGAVSLGSFSIANINAALLASTVPGTANSLPTGSIFINFMASNTAELFDRIVLSSSSVGGNSFRIDNIAYQIPTPALLPGLVAFGVGVLRKRKAMDEVCEDSVNS